MGPEQNGSFDTRNSNHVECFLCEMPIEIELCGNDFILTSWLSKGTKLGQIGRIGASKLTFFAQLNMWMMTLRKGQSFNLETPECLRGACERGNNLKKVVMIITALQNWGTVVYQLLKINGW